MLRQMKPRWLKEIYQGQLKDQQVDKGNSTKQR